MRWCLSIFVWLALCIGAWAQDHCPIKVVAIQAAPALKGGEYPVNGSWEDVTLPDAAWHRFSDGNVFDEHAGNNGIWYRIDW